MPQIDLAFGGLANSQDETKTPSTNCWSMQNCTTLRGVLEGAARYTLFGARTSTNASDIGWGFGYGKYSANEVQRLALSYSTAPTSGDIDLVFSGQQTATALGYNATATQALTSLEALSNINIGDIKATGGPWPSVPIDIEFTGQYANTDVSAITGADNTLNNSATLTVTVRRKGGEQEVFLVAVQHNGESTVTMYSVDLSTGTFTSIATGLTASDWFFVQYGDRIFAHNATDGLNYYRIGGSWNDGAGSTKPKAPVVAPTFSYSLAATTVDFSTGWASIGQSGLGGAPTVTGKVDGISVVADTAVTSRTQVTITATYSSAQDQHFNDIFRVYVAADSITEAVIVEDTIEFRLINNDGSPVTISPIVTAFREGGYVGFFHFANSQRTSRDNILKYEIKFTVSSWATTEQVYISVLRGLSWMATEVPFEFEVDGRTNPSLDAAKIKYAYSYYNATTAVESDLSEAALTQVVPSNWAGANVTLTLRGSSELTVNDRIYVYRQERRTGIWRRLPTNANNLTTYGAANVTSGTTTFVDKWMEEELKDFQARDAADFGGVRTSSAGVAISWWKQSLVLGQNRKAWLSFVGFLPSEAPVFAPDPDDRAATIQFNQENSENPDRGRTVYMSDNRAEEVYGIVGQDTLYLIGPDSSYAMVGDSPSESSPPRRLPGSRGAVGQRGVYPYKGGVHAMAPDGLYYYAVGRGFSGEDNGALVSSEDTEGVRRSYKTTLLGSSYSGAVVIEHEDEVWLFNGTKYLVNNRNKRWEEGTFTDSVKAAISVRSSGLYFLDSRGRIMKISESYSTDNGTSVAWSYTTGLLEGPRVRITDLEIHSVGTPRVTVHVYTPDGSESDTYGRYDVHHFDTPDYATNFRTPCAINGGQRHRFIFSGTAGSDKVTSAVLHYEGQGKPYHG